MGRIIVLAATVIVAGCQTVPPMVQTASGRPEKVYPGIPMERVQSALAEACMNRPAVVEANTPGQLICTREATGGDAILGSMIVGGSHGSTPKFKVRFTLIDTGGAVRVQGYQTIESTNAFGRVDQEELNSGAQFNNVQQMLEAVASKLGSKAAAN